MAAQSPPVFEAFSELTSPHTGEHFEIGFRLRNAEGRNFRPPVWDRNIRVLGGPSSEQSMGFINGRSYTQQTWRFLVEVRKAGPVVVGPASVTADAKTIQSQPLTLNIGDGQATVNAPNGNTEAFVVTELTPASAFIGQQVIRRVLLYTLIDIDGLDILEIPPVKGCFTADRKRFDARLRNHTLRGKKYVVKTLSEAALFPQESGKLDVLPAKIRVDLAQSGGQGGFLNTTSRILETAPASLEVKPLPTPAPPHFSGCTGVYVWEVKADKTTLTTDDALAITVNLRGNGDPHRFAPPALQLPPGLEALDPKVVSEERYETDQQWVHEQVLEYAILPKKPGVYLLQPAYAWFQPDSNRYLTYAPDSLRIEVQPGPNYSDHANTAASGRETEGDLPLSSSWWSMHAIRRVFRSPWLWGGVASIALLFFLLTRHRPLPPPEEAEAPSYKKPPPTPAVVPPAPAFHDLLEQARTAALQNNSDAVAAYKSVLRVLSGFIREQFHLKEEPLDRQQAAALLGQRRVAPVSIQNFLRIWDQCEAALYGHWEGAPSPSQLLQEAEKITTDLRNTLSL
jgi:hypothetical protein